MTRAVQIVAAGALTGMLCACASEQRMTPAAADATAARNTIAADLVRTAASLHGRSQADVFAALGPATVLRFDSGYEVWVYRFDDPPAGKRAEARGKASLASDEREGEARSELVMLFTPSGVVGKLRVRSAPLKSTGER